MLFFSLLPNSDITNWTKYFDKIKCYSDRPYLVYFSLKPETHTWSVGIVWWSWVTHSHIVSCCACCVGGGCFFCLNTVVMPYITINVITACSYIFRISTQCWNRMRKMSGQGLHKSKLGRSHLIPHTSVISPESSHAVSGEISSKIYLICIFYFPGEHFSG